MHTTRSRWMNRREVTCLGRFKGGQLGQECKGDTISCKFYFSFNRWDETCTLKLCKHCARLALVDCLEKIQGVESFRDFRT